MSHVQRREMRLCHLSLYWVTSDKDFCHFALFMGTVARINISYVYLLQRYVRLLHVPCRGQVVPPASQDSTAVIAGISTSDVFLLLKIGLRYVPKWKTEG